MCLCPCPKPTVVIPFNLIIISNYYRCQHFFQIIIVVNLPASTDMRRPTRVDLSVLYFDCHCFIWPINHLKYMIQININNVYSARKKKLQYEKHDFIAMQTQQSKPRKTEKRNRSTAYVTVPLISKQAYLYT